MNLEHVKLFLRIQARGSLSAAGRGLGLSAAVASNAINKLEHTLGVRLIHRTTRKVSLTQEGMAFLPHAENLLASAEAARASVGAGSTHPSGTLRIAAPASFGRMHLLPGLKSFLQHYPGIKVDLKLSDSIVDLVEGGFDVAVRNSALKDSSMIARKLAADRRLLCASPDYLAANGTPRTPEALGEHNCITLMGLDQWHFNGPAGEVRVKAQGSLRTDNGEAIRDACCSGIGISINSLWSVYRELEAGALVEVMPDYPLINETAIWVIYPNSRLLAPKVRAFIDFFSAHFGDTPYWERAIESLQCDSNL